MWKSELDTLWSIRAYLEDTVRHDFLFKEDKKQFNRKKKSWNQSQLNKICKSAVDKIFIGLSKLIQSFLHGTD